MAESAWAAPSEQLGLVLESGAIDAMVAEAAAWAERITVCVTAPDSQRGGLAFWGEVLARSPKCDRIFVRRAEHAEPWLLHRLHDTGALRLLERGGKQVASNLLMFSRGAELRVLLAHIPLDRAVAGAAFGALLAYNGASDSVLGRACRAQAESSSAHAHIPCGSEIDALTREAQRAAAPAPMLSAGPLGVVLDPTELGLKLERFLTETPGASLRAIPGGYRLLIAWRAPFALTLHTGAGWASGNALLLEARDGTLVLVWRGGLLGHARARDELAWSETRLESLRLKLDVLGGERRVAVIAHGAAPIEPQLRAFASEVARLSEVFGVEPPPALGHALADFASLSAKKQTLFVHKALLGLGALELDAAVSIAAEVLRDQGYLHSSGAATGSDERDLIAELIQSAAEAGQSFDRPRPGAVRAIQPDLGAYVLDDWLACLLRALPDGALLPRRSALRLALDHAREHWGLEGARLVRGSALERRLEQTLTSALRRGLLTRVGADDVQRLAGAPAAVETPPIEPERCPDGFIGGFSRGLERLDAVRRNILSRRVGWYGKREALDGIAQRLGLTLERTRQLELEAWQQLEADFGWISTLRARLARGIGTARAVPVAALARDDAWWRGAEARPSLCEAACEALLGGDLRLVELGSAQRRDAFFARFERADLERALAALLESAGAIPTPAAFDEYRALCAASAAAFDVGLVEYLSDALEPHLQTDPMDPMLVVRFEPNPGASLEHLPTESKAVDSEALLRLEDTLRSVFRSAGTPLSFDAVAERVRQRLDVSDTLLGERLQTAPFVRRNPDQYGLINRDVPGGSEAIAAALDAITEALARSERALDPEQALACVAARVSHPWSPDLVRSLIGSDPTLSLSPTHEVTLRRWEHARLAGQNEFICPGIPASLRARFTQKLAAGAEAEALGRRVRSELERLERSGDSDDFGSLPLARQLGDLSQRLIELSLGESPESARNIARAAAGCFLEAVAPNEDDPDAPLLDREALLETRRLFAAVLRWLELDWLEPS